MLWATADETHERFLQVTCANPPADPGDIRIEVGQFEDGMEETPFWARLIDDQGEVIDMHFFGSGQERGDMIAALRESQARRAEADRLGLHPLEIEFAPFGPAWQREQVVILADTYDGVAFRWMFEYRSDLDATYPWAALANQEAR